MLLVGGGALCLVPDATFIRLTDAGDVQTAFWRSLFVGISLAVVTLVRHRAGAARAYRSVGRSGLAVSLLWGLQLLLFVYAVNHTAVANALVILATAPFFAALFTRLLIGEAIHARTWFAMVGALGGVAFTFASAVRLGGMTGNLAAVAVAAGMGLNFTMIRRAGGTSADADHATRDVACGVDMVPAISVAGFVAAAAALPLAWPVGITGRDAVTIGVMGLVLVPAAFTLFTLGSRHLASPEVTLLMTLETVLGPLLAWTAIDESPPPLGLLGGAAVLATLVLHSRAALRHHDRPQAGVSTSSLESTPVRLGAEPAPASTRERFLYSHTAGEALPSDRTGGGRAVITRIWRGWTKTDQAGVYNNHYRDEVVPVLRAVPGFRGARLLRRTIGDETEFTSLTFFDDLEAIRDFAGSDYETAVVADAARLVLVRFEENVAHYETAFET